MRIRVHFKCLDRRQFSVVHLEQYAFSVQLLCFYPYRMSSSPTPSRAAPCRVYALIVTWLGISIFLILLNKHILSYIPCPYPLTLAFLHMLTGGILAQVWTCIQKRHACRFSEETSRTCFFCIGILLAINLSLSNVAFLHLSVPLIQMLKAATPASIYLLGLIMRTERYGHIRAGLVALITMGVFLSAYGSIKNDFVGISAQLIAIIADSLRCVLLQRELQHGASNPVYALASFAPLAAVLLLMPSVSEWSSIMASTCIESPRVWWVLLSCGVAFVLNIVVCQLIGATSALTTSLTGIVKEWICIGLTIGMYKIIVTPTQWCGYTMSLCGLVWYHLSREFMAQENKKCSTANDDEGTDRHFRVERWSRVHVIDATKAAFRRYFWSIRWT